MTNPTCSLSSRLQFKFLDFYLYFGVSVQTKKQKGSHVSLGTGLKRHATKKKERKKKGKKGGR